MCSHDRDTREFVFCAMRQDRFHFRLLREPRSTIKRQFNLFVEAGISCILSRSIKSDQTLRRLRTVPPTRISAMPTVARGP